MDLQSRLLEFPLNEFIYIFFRALCLCVKKLYIPFETCHIREVGQTWKETNIFGLLGFHALQEAPSCDFFLAISALPSDNSRDSLFQLHIYTGGAAAAVHDFICSHASTWISHARKLMFDEETGVVVIHETKFILMIQLGLHVANITFGRTKNILWLAHFDKSWDVLGHARRWAQ